MTSLTAIGFTLLSALLLALGIPNEVFALGFAPAGLISLIPLYIALRSRPSWHLSGFLGGLMMMTVHLISSFWLLFFKDFAIFTLGGSTLFCFLIGVPAGYALRLAMDQKVYLRPFAFALAWTLWEWTKSTGFFAYPWGTIIMSSRSLLPLIQIVEITGTWGLSFLLSLIGALGAELLLYQGSWKKILTKECSGELLILRRSAVFTLSLVLLASIWGLTRIYASSESTKAVTVVMVQHNTDAWDEEDGVRKAITTSMRLTRDAIASDERPVDLVVWSESVLGHSYLENRRYFDVFPAEDPFVPFLNEIGVPVLVGSPVLVNRDERKWSNSVILLSPQGEQLDWYAKIQLVPFAEYMPFTEHEWVKKFFDKIVGFSSGWQPGTEYKNMAVTTTVGETVRFATPICFEDAFALLNTRLYNTGSEMLINLTNDSWSKTASAEYQHFVIASFRAIELRVPLLRSTNGGYTAAIDPVGRVTADLPLFEEASLKVTVPLYERVQTLYSRWGDWFPQLLSFLFLFLVFRRIKTGPTVKSLT